MLSDQKIEIEKSQHFVCFLSYLLFEEAIDVYFGTFTLNTVYDKNILEAQIFEELCEW